MAAVFWAAVFFAAVFFAGARFAVVSADSSRVPADSPETAAAAAVVFLGEVVVFWSPDAGAALRAPVRAVFFAVDFFATFRPVADAGVAGAVVPSASFPEVELVLAATKDLSCGVRGLAVGAPQ